MKTQTSLETIARHLTATLDCTQEQVCRQILHALATVGHPLAPAYLATLMQISQDELHTHLARVPDTEFDAQGHIVGWGITLLPTQHQFLLQERPLFTWCAFDTVLFPPLIQVEAQIQSVCEASGQTITFVATPEGVADLLPKTSVLSLILPTERCDCVRGTFCQRSLFFQSEGAALPWLALHPKALLLSLEEAAFVGQTVAKLWPHESTT